MQNPGDELSPGVFFVIESSCVCVLRLVLVDW
jgi:hypothetical protein